VQGGGTEEIKWMKSNEGVCEECLNPDEK